MRNACIYFLKPYMIEQQKVYEKNNVHFTQGVVQYNQQILLDVPKFFADHTFRVFPYEHFIWDLWDKARLFKNKNGRDNVPDIVLLNAVNKLRHVMHYGKDDSIFDDLFGYFYGIMKGELEWYQKTQAVNEQLEREIWERAERKYEEREMSAYTRMKYEQYYGGNRTDRED